MKDSVPAAAPAIEVKNLSFAYRHTPIVTKATFTVTDGQSVGIIGPNGGGKTTLLRLLMGFLEPTEGTIHIKGLPPAAARHLMGYVPQSLQYDRLFPISTLELVLSGCLSRLPWYGRYKRADHAMAMAMLDRVGIADFASHQFGSLSGGQRQRALIARALVSEPEVLFLDEPTSNVDPEAAHEIDALITELHGEKTVMRVTHHLRSVVEDVDSIFCVEKTVSQLDPQQVCDHFAIGLYHTPLVNLPKKSPSKPASKPATDTTSGDCGGESC